MMNVLGGDKPHRYEKNVIQGGHMKKYIINPGEKGIDALHVQEMPSRQLKPDEVCVRVQAASLNYREIVIQLD